MNTLDAMQTFVRVAELSSFTRAAESLGMPKASMSSAVSRLEAELGTQLLHRTTRKVREGFDCVLRVGALNDSSLVARPLGHLRVLNCASPSYIEKYGMPRTLDDLSRHRLVHYVRTLGAKPDGFEYFDGTAYRTLPMAATVTVNSVEGYDASCRAGFGIIQAPAIGTRHLIEQGLLVEVLPQYQAEPMPVSLVYAQRRNLPRRVQAFMAWMAQTLGPHLKD